MSIRGTMLRRALSTARAHSVTLADIKALRARTGAPIQAVKAALAAHGDMELAADYLRRQGLALSAKRAATRGVLEGGVGMGTTPCGTAGALVAVGCETDFVARNSRFRELLDTLVAEALAGGDVHTHAAVGDAAAALQEALEVRQVRVLRGARVAGYVHAGRIGALVALEGASAGEPAAAAAARRAALHVAAAGPRALSRDDLPAEAVEAERRALHEAAVASGKAAHVVQRIVNGKMDKWYAECCLAEQEMLAEVDGYCGKSRSVTKSIAAECADVKLVAYERLSHH